MNEALPRILLRENAASMEILGISPEPFGDLSYPDIVSAYADDAFAKKLAGAKILLMRGFSGLVESRAALLGARQTGLPVMLSLKLNEDHETENGADPLAALICLQELGLAAFGLCGNGDAVIESLKRLAPYANIPLFADIDAENARNAFSAGAEILDAYREDNPAEIARRIDGLTTPEKPARIEDSPILLADETQVYYLEEDFTASGPIDCETDIAGQILRAEDEGYDVLLFHITNLDEAANFAAEEYMTRRAVAIRAESEEILENALFHYTGRAIIDSRSDVEDHVMESLANGYGAVIR